MSDVVIKDLIANGENERMEFKESFRKEVIETVVAFSNTKGGRIVIGVDDKKRVVGVDIGTETVQQYLNQIKLSTQPAVIPDIDVLKVDGKEILLITCSEYPVKPVSVKGRYYKRKGNSNHLMSSSEISDLYIKVLNLSWDAYEYSHAAIDDLDIFKIEKFLKKVNETGRFYVEGSSLEMLEKLNYIKNDKLTFAAMLLFAQEPVRMHIRVGRFKDDITILDDRQITDTLFEAVEDTMKFIKTYMMVAYEFDGSIQRIEKWDYPIKAIREAVLNAVVHRDYREPSDIQIKIYDNKIVIFNPGKLYGDLTIEDLKNRNYQSSIRNRLIAEAFYLTGNIEKYGTGFIRIENELKNYPNNSYEFKEISGGMQITFYKNDATVNATEDVGNSSCVENELENELENNLKEREKEIIKLISDNPKITQKEMSEKIGITPQNIRKHIARLKQKGILLRIGPDKGGYWKINEGK